jgi:hypothetical protein
MDALSEFLGDLKRRGLAEGNFLGLLHLLIGRPVSTAEGRVISQGLTWRELANLLKKVRWNKQYVRELGLDPDELPPRNRQRYWYTAIARADISSAEAEEQAKRLAERLTAAGYIIGPIPE